MSIDARIPASLIRLVRNKAGNFSIMGALLLPVGLAAAGIALDTSKMIATKAALQNAADAAALAAAAALANKQTTVTNAKVMAVDFIKGQMANHTDSDEEKETPFNFADCTNVTVDEATTIGTSKKYDVSVTTCYDVKYSTLASFLGKSGSRLTVKSVTQS
ncbi:MAG: hypothetical protein RLZZ444_2640, partial [Pseudomonadota bacterium]